MSLYGTPPVLDLLSGDTRVSLSLMEPPANVMKRVSRESGSTDLSVSTIDWDDKTGARTVGCYRRVVR